MTHGSPPLCPVHASNKAALRHARLKRLNPLPRSALPIEQWRRNTKPLHLVSKRAWCDVGRVLPRLPARHPASNWRVDVPACPARHLRSRISHPSRFQSKQAAETFAPIVAVAVSGSHLRVVSPPTKPSPNWQVDCNPSVQCLVGSCATSLGLESINQPTRETFRTDVTIAVGETFDRNSVCCDGVAHAISWEGRRQDEKPNSIYDLGVYALDLPH